MLAETERWSYQEFSSAAQLSFFVCWFNIFLQSVDVSTPWLTKTGPLLHFYRASAYTYARYCYSKSVRPSVRLSVCPSVTFRYCIKRLNVLSSFFHRTVAQIRIKNYFKNLVDVYKSYSQSNLGHFLRHSVVLNKLDKNLAIANRSRLSCGHNTLRASIGRNITPWPWNLG